MSGRTAYGTIPRPMGRARARGRGAAAAARGGRRRAAAAARARREPAAVAARAGRELAVAATLIATLALAGAGCGEDSPPARPEGGRLDVTLDDFLISPQRVRARPGRIAFAAVNRGRVVHTLRVLRGEREVVAIETLLPGERGRDSATFARGRYKLVCVLGNHDELGMYGTLTVR
jgi:plastocyanin